MGDLIFVSDEKREVDVALVRSQQSLERIKELYRNRSKENLVLTSAFIHPAQKEMIDILSQDTGKGKAEVLRDLIDEWVEFKVIGSNGRL